MKLIAFALLAVSSLLLAACESTTAPKDTSGNGTPLGDSNVRVSGYIESGGAVSPR